MLHDYSIIRNSGYDVVYLKVSTDFLDVMPLLILLSSYLYIYMVPL